jgi:hypothetical protein
MSVPKCKECEHHRYEVDTPYMNQKHHNCHHRDAEIGKVNRFGRMVLSTESRTSPKWCPKRGGEIQCQT